MKESKSKNDVMKLILFLILLIISSIGVILFMLSTTSSKLNDSKNVLSKFQNENKNLKLEVLHQKNIIINLENLDKELNIKISELQKENLNLLKTKECQSDKEDDSKKCSNNESFIVKEDVLTYKFVNMNVGAWNFEENDKKDFLNVFKNIDVSNKDKEFIIFEIIPIVDSKNYQNDKDDLKQLGLSRMRASVATGLLNSLGKGKVFLSTEVIKSENERGFIVKQYSIKIKN